MCIVQWCDHEGILQERRFERARDADAEAYRLSEEHDGVQVVKEE